MHDTSHGKQRQFIAGTTCVNRGILHSVLRFFSVLITLLLRRVPPMKLHNSSNRSAAVPAATPSAVPARVVRARKVKATSARRTANPASRKAGDAAPTKPLSNSISATGAGVDSAVEHSKYQTEIRKLPDDSEIPSIQTRTAVSSPAQTRPQTPMSPTPSSSSTIVAHETAKSDKSRKLPDRFRAPEPSAENGSPFSGSSLATDADVTGCVEEVNGRYHFQNSRIKRKCEASQASQRSLPTSNCLACGGSSVPYSQPPAFDRTAMIVPKRLCDTCSSC